MYQIFFSLKLGKKLPKISRCLTQNLLPGKYKVLHPEIQYMNLTFIELLKAKRKDLLSKDIKGNIYASP